MNDYVTKIGEVKSVNGNNVTIKLYDNIKSNLPVIDGEVYKIGQIGSYLKIPLGYSILYGIVSQVGASAIPSSIIDNANLYSDIENSQWVSISLVGEQFGNKFQRGISQSPTTGDAVHLVTIDDLYVIYSGEQTNSTIQIGNISSSSTLPALLNLNRLLTRHFSILGSTGSGKSNAVGVLVNSIEGKKFKNSRVIIIDPHGEYADSIEKSKVFQLKPKRGNNKLVIPFWALPFNELMTIIGDSLNDANYEYVREKINNEKIESNRINKYGVKEELITADSPIPFSIKKVWFELIDFEKRTFKTNALLEEDLELEKKGDIDKLIPNKYKPAALGGGSPFINRYAKGIIKFLDSLRMKLKDRRFKFLFEPDEYTPDKEGKISKDIDNLIYSWIGEKGVSIFDLSDVPSEVMVSITGTLLKIMYDTLYWGQETEVGGKMQPLLIILEEAHNYLYKDSNNISSKTVQKIAKEGRKYGVGLCLVSQRPSELDETILSQCGTIISLRMNNFSDRNFVKGAIQDELQGLLDILPALRTGEAIISGEGVNIPQRVQFYKLHNAIKGSNPLVSDRWNDEKTHTISEYTDVLERWRNQSFYKEVSDE